ncbi:MAG: glycosyl transferase [Sphingobacteriia bacterium]|nr:MAG: glycosyl transferase [Sphingobacteriia bacterium]
MKLIHLILAHDPAGLSQLERLVNQLIYRDSIIYIHVDLKTDLSIFKNHFNNNSTVRFINNRVSVKWASYTMVEAELNSFQQIINEEPDFDFLNLLSSQDYPIRPIGEFYQFLSLNIGKAFMHCLDIETEWIEAKQRFTKYHFVNHDFRGIYLIQNIVNSILPERRIPSDLVIKGRSQWFTISRKHIEYVLETLKMNKAIVRFFKFTWSPDELVFQTLLFNSPYQNDIVNNNLRYIDWSEQKKNPKILTEVDFEAIIQSGNFFARKFNLSASSSILNLIDIQISG